MTEVFRGLARVVLVVHSPARVERFARARDDVAWPVPDAAAVAVVKMRRDRALGRIHHLHPGGNRETIAQNAVFERFGFVNVAASGIAIAISRFRHVALLFVGSASHKKTGVRSSVALTAACTAASDGSPVRCEATFCKKPSR
jgi:hypothetical protein